MATGLNDQSNKQSDIWLHEYVACDLCGATDTAPKFIIDMRNTQLSRIWIDGVAQEILSQESLVTCKKCGLVYVNPRLAARPGVVAYDAAMELQYFEQTRAARQQAYQMLVDNLPRWLGRPAQTLLDIGCGDGLLIEVARQAGIQSAGLEISPDLIEFVRTHIGGDVLVPPDITQLPAAFYDVVALINVIEHLYEPSAMLSQLHRVLKPGGILLVHTPNLGGLPARIAKEHWHQIEPLGHFYYFDQRTLAAMLKKNGFQPFARFNLITSVGPKYWLHRFLGAIGLYLDNGLGMVSQRPG